MAASPAVEGSWDWMKGRDGKATRAGGGAVDPSWNEVTKVVSMHSRTFARSITRQGWRRRYRRIRNVHAESRSLNHALSAGG
ncbi:hypothetical protein GCM10010298_72900 [Streptomyces microflavus]|uniref:Uncharacterized protein n=1 Tax=Streptomyces microflavus TaxID=1919 RepID=A0A7J0CIP8_STRMI|nr:hypothetical protein Smic_09180 [Streptomyces microflavus]GGX96951.1 hypothetical protein GCM10010298_72900 [Streptomyces microflavus]